MTSAIEGDDDLLSQFPLIQYLVEALPGQSYALTQDRYTQSVINILLQAGKVAEVAGHKHPTATPLEKANPVSVLTEIERMLGDIVILIEFSRRLVQEQKHQ